MSWLTRFGPVMILALMVVPAAAEEEPGRVGVAWSADVSTAFATAKEEQKVLMVCVNARHVKGRSDEEPAARGLREVVYRDPRVVEKSRDFVCALLTSQGSSEEFGELRALGIDGDLVSPQHLFVHPDGNAILLRKRYWSHGQGESAVKALLELMEQAQQKLAGAGAEPESADGAEVAPEGAERAAWIAGRVKQVVAGPARDRDEALRSLAQNDEDGDCLGPLIVLLPEHKKDAALLSAVVRTLGRDGLEGAALPIAELLAHKDVSVRANAAVSLEYIGSRGKQVVAALKKAAGKEKDEGVANHVYRALGRCGVADAKSRALLIKRVEATKSEFGSYGPVIGLAYFEGDAKAIRGVEKLLKKMGVPGGKRGGGQNTVKRGLLSWTLAAIGDAKSASFVREQLMAKLKNVQAFWVDGLLAFWEAVALKCEGHDAEMAGIEDGVRAFVGFAKRFDLGRYGAETRSLMDEYRKGRDTSTFQPKGDDLLDSGDGG